MKLYTKIAATLSIFALASAAHAIVIDYTGGSVNGAYTTHYEEDGFQFDVTGSSGAFVGDYYGAGNDVVHAHWDAGDFGNVTRIVYSKIAGGTFDLNYFILTSNTEFGGGFASGNERAFITHDNGLDPIMLPPQNWGFPASQIFLPSSYDAVTTFEFYVENAVDCFGMDEFFIDEPAPSAVPEAGSTVALLALGAAGLLWLRRRVKA